MFPFKNGNPFFVSVFQSYSVNWSIKSAMVHNVHLNETIPRCASEFSRAFNPGVGLSVGGVGGTSPRSQVSQPFSSSFSSKSSLGRQICPVHPHPSTAQHSSHLPFSPAVAQRVLVSACVSAVVSGPFERRPPSPLSSCVFV